MRGCIILIDMRRKPKYTIDEIRLKVAPIARRRGLKKVSLFGSYARGEARAKSDVDLLVYDPEFKMKSLLDVAGLWIEFEKALDKAKVDVVEAEALDGDRFSQRVLRDEVVLYAERT